MVKTIALIVGLLIMGVAPLAHADLYHLGAGGCRTPGGGSGTYVLHQQVSWAQCRLLCHQNNQCKAVEYTIRYNGVSNCEVHTAPINQTTGWDYNRQSNTSCWGYTP